jgi:uncharacterized protein (TIGR02246 family)
MTQRRTQVQLVIAVFLVIGAGVALLVPSDIGVGAQTAAAAAKLPAGSREAANGADELAIRSTADDFVKAFNAADAKAVGALWASDAKYTDESGHVFSGRAAIEKEYADLFKEHQGATVAVAIESIHFLGPDIAIEKGVAKVQLPAENAGTGSRYTVVHAKRDGKWIMVVGRDAPYVEIAGGEALKDLEWLIGEWSPEAKDQPLRIKFEWMAQKNFIKNTFAVMKEGEESLTGGQIIGWNPKLGHIVSWHFDAQGGFGDDVWTKDGSKWIIEATGVFRNGSESAAVNVLTPIDANRFTWQSLKRTLDGVELPNATPITMVRAPASK